MPDWAVDKHTFRGKFGKGCLHIVKKKGIPETFDDAMVEEFYGERPKRNLNSFFNEATLVVDEMLENPFYPQVIETYLKYPKNKQKTTHMTAEYFKELRRSHPGIIGGIKTGKKRKRDKNENDNIDKLTRKKLKMELEHSFPARGHTTSQTSRTDTGEPNEAVEEPWKTGPLLQLPTGSAKVHTRIDVRGNKVWKGPYSNNKLSNVMFFHLAMRDVLKDAHTLPVQLHGQFVSFPLLKASSAHIQVETRN